MMSQAMTGMGGTQGVMGKMAQFQAQILQIQQTLVVSTDQVLLKWNQSVFQPNGVQWTASMPSAAMQDTSQIGVIMKKMPQQMVVIVQQQPQQQPGSGALP